MAERRQHSPPPGTGKAISAPIFPLSNVVFFPHTLLPLHVFEPRYRALVSAALDADRLIAIVLAHRDRPVGAQPDIHPVGCVGRVEVEQRLDDGRFVIVLSGLARVGVQDLKLEPGQYFSAELEVLGECLPDLQDPRVANETARFLLVARRYCEIVLGGDIPVDFLAESLPYPVLVNRAASVVRVPLADRQELLTVDDVEARAELVRGWMEGQARSYGAIPDFSDRRPADPSVN